MGEYEFDIFVSFPDGCSASDWVRNHFIRMLRNSILDVHGVDLNVFAFHERDGGYAVGADVEHALLHSKLLLPILTPPYAYKSEWCCAEWATFAARESMTGLATAQNPRSLIHPVLYSGDLSAFPEELRRPRINTDMREYANPDDAFKNSQAYHGFREATRELARALCAAKDLAPQWDENWPIVRPGVFRRPAIKVPRL